MRLYVAKDYALFARIQQRAMYTARIAQPKNLGLEHLIDLYILGIVGLKDK